MFTGRAQLIRIIGDPDNQRPDEWSSTVIEWLRTNGGMITDKGKSTYSEETVVKSQRLNASVLVQPKDSVRPVTHYPHITWAHVMLRVQLGCERRSDVEFYDADSHFRHSAYVTW
jgi:hypothetical protein